MEQDGAGGAGDIDRIATLSQEMVRDISAWLELRTALLEAEVEQRIKARQKVFVAYGGAAFAGGAAFVLLLIAASLGLGVLLGHAALGFLTVGAVLGVVVLGTYLVLRRFDADGTRNHRQKKPDRS